MSRRPSLFLMVLVLACGRGAQPTAEGRDGPPASAGAGGSGGNPDATGGSPDATGSSPDATGGTAGSPPAPDAQPDRAPVDGPPAPDGPAACQPISAFSKACATAADCVPVLHRVDCCGNQVALGLAASERARFDAAESACRASVPLCPCPTGDIKTSDGSRLRSPGEPLAVACVAGACIAYRAGCGAPCSAGTQCFDCPEAGRTGYYCSVACDTSAGCAGQPHPTCTAVTIPRFCAPPSCGTRSRAQWKRDINYLDAGARRSLADQLLAMRLATYQYREEPAQARRRLGFIIDDVGTSPAVAADGATVDLYGYASLAVAAVQVQAEELAQLRREVARLRTELRRTRR